MLLYFGPEVLVPVLSAAAAAIGAILIAGKRVLHAIRSAGRWLLGLFGWSPDGESGESEIPEEEGTSQPSRHGEPSGPAQ